MFIDEIVVINKMIIIVVFLFFFDLLYREFVDVIEIAIMIIIPLKNIVDNIIRGILLFEFFNVNISGKIDSDIVKIINWEFDIFLFDVFFIIFRL